MPEKKRRCYATVLCFLKTAALLLCLTSNNGLANSNEFFPLQSDELNRNSVGSHLYYYKDDTRAFDLENIRDLDISEWRLGTLNTKNFGATDANIWLGLHLENVEVTDKEFYLILKYALLDHIEFFSINSAGEMTHYLTGDTVPFAERPIHYPSFVFPFEVQRNESSIVYLKVSSQGSVEIPVQITTKENFYPSQLAHLFIYVASLSILLVMAVYNMILFWSVKDSTHLFYSGYCIGVLLYFACASGFAYQYLWPESVGWHQISSVFFSAVMAAFIGLFSLKFLPLKRFVISRWVLVSLSIFALFSASTSFYLSYDQVFKIAVLATLAMNVCALLIGCIIWSNGEKIARLYVVTWSLHFIMSTYWALAKGGVLPVFDYSEYFVPVSSVIVSILLSFALADRIAQNQRIRVEAQNEAVESLNRFKNLFETAIEGIFVVKMNGGWIDANPSLLKLLGYESIDDLKGDSVRTRQDTLKSKAYKSLLAVILAKREVIEYQALLVKKEGKSFWASVNARVVTSKDGTELIEGSLVDVSARVAFEDKLNYLARHDSLTNLYNRRAFEDAILDALKQGQSEGKKFALLYLDLDQFKLLNDTCGHTAGDKLLVQLSSRLSSNLQPNQFLARLGGDEFGLLISDCNEGKSRVLAENILELVRTFRFRYSERDFAIGVSIGLVNFSDEFVSLEALLSRADTACFMAKDLGRNRIHVYHETDEQIRQRQSEMQWVRVLKDAIKNNHFVLTYQNIKNNQDNSHGYHYELLLRLKMEGGKLVGPNSFIPAAERYGLMAEVDEWVVETYFNWLHNHAGHLVKLEKASINLSGHSLGSEAFIEHLDQLFSKYHIPHEKICFEITETMAITCMDKTIDFIHKYRELGCSFALDDFGTGFSSYAYLKELPVDNLKIDGFFIRNMAEDNVDMAMVKSIQQVAETMGIQTIAEFVESSITLDLLNEIGIPFSQGFYLHQPTELSKFEEENISV